MIDLRVWQPTINGSTMSSRGFTLSEGQEAIDEVKRLRCELAKYKKRAMPEAKKILKNGDYMTVLWADGTKTIVKRAADEAESDYAAFTAAFAIRSFGSNSALKRIVASAEEQGKKKKKKKEEVKPNKVEQALDDSAVALIKEMAKLWEDEYEQQKTDEWLDGIEKKQNDNRS